MREAKEMDGGSERGYSKDDLQRGHAGAHIIEQAMHGMIAKFSRHSKRAPMGCGQKDLRVMLHRTHFQMGQQVVGSGATCSMIAGLNDPLVSGKRRDLVKFDNGVHVHSRCTCSH